MEPESSRLRHREQLETTQQFAQQQGGGREFASVEEMIREDMAQTEVPPAVAVKLKESLAREGIGPRPWWKRIFSRNETQP
jgi:hypothetical protein